ncbi:MAG: glycosyltransferase family 4 protein, partial [Actinomycetota bacterium]
SFRQDVEASGLSDRFALVPHVADPLEWFSAMDVFVLPAREDAFPLVCLEAAAQGVPVVCFDNGGMPEYVDGADEECGAVVPYPDLDAMADAVLAFASDDDRRERAGKVGAARVRANYDVPAVAPGLWKTVEGVLP